MNRVDVISAYQLLLGRLPESESVIKEHLARNKDVAQLRFNIMNSMEFKSILNKVINVQDYLPSEFRNIGSVQYDVEDISLSILMGRIKKEWEAFGNTEPHWSVLTHSDFKQNNLHKNREFFYDSGRFISDLILSVSRYYKIDISGLDCCFELGCGVGRMTLHLSRLFKTVIAADISKPHLNICQAELDARGVTNFQLLHLAEPTDLRGAGSKSYDFFCSFIVLQHNPPPIIAYMLRNLLGQLNKGGVAIFQVPTYIKGYSFEIDDYLRCSNKPSMEMHCLPQSVIFEIAASHNCRVLEVREDNWIGNRKNWISNTFVLNKA